MPSWIAAGAAVLASLLLACTVLIAGRVGRREAERLALVRRWYEEYRDERARTQARLVCAWPVSERETFEKVVQRGVVGAAVRNASEFPIFDVELLYRDPPAGWSCVRRIRMIPPSVEPQIYAGFDEEATTSTPHPERRNADGSIRLAASAQMHLEFRFTDGQGRRWVRDDHGQLADAPTEPVVLVPVPESVDVVRE